MFIREKQWQLTSQSVSGEFTPVTHVPFTIGRESDNSLSIRHSTVSGQDLNDEWLHSDLCGAGAF